MILENISPNIEFYTRVQTFKGWFYVIITTLLIYSLLRLYISKKNAAIHSLELIEIELKHELSEKELLLNEVHHRVKNNLQMLTSLIGLRIDSGLPSECLPVVGKISDQLHSLSLTYERVYQEEQTSNVNIEAYIKDIAGYHHSNYPQPEEITVSYEIDNTNLSLEKAVPLSIIISESLSNSFRHAFKAKAGGLIKINFQQDESKYSLSIEDNGSGIDAESRDDGLGLELIKMLTHQLNGELKIKSEPGATRIELKFT